MRPLDEFFAVDKPIEVLMDFRIGRRLQYNNNGVWEDYNYKLEQLLQELLLELQTGEERVRVSKW
jgi:hypothetical protein